MKTYKLTIIIGGELHHATVQARNIRQALDVVEGQGTVVAILREGESCQS